MANSDSEGKLEVDLLETFILVKKKKKNCWAWKKKKKKTFEIKKKEGRRRKIQICRMCGKTLQKIFKNEINQFMHNRFFDD